MALQEAFIAVARQTIQMTQISRRNVVVAKRERAAIGDADSLVLVQGRANRIKNLQLAGHVGVQKSIPARALGMHEGTIHRHLKISGGTRVLLARNGDPAGKLVEDKGLGRAKTRPVTSSATPLDRNIHHITCFDLGLR